MRPRAADGLLWAVLAAAVILVWTTDSQLVSDVAMSVAAVLTLVLLLARR